MSTITWKVVDPPRVAPVLPPRASVMLRPDIEWPSGDRVLGLPVRYGVIKGVPFRVQSLWRLGDPPTSGYKAAGPLEVAIIETPDKVTLKMYNRDVVNRGTQVRASSGNLTMSLRSRYPTFWSYNKVRNRRRPLRRLSPETFVKRLQRVSHGGDSYYHGFMLEEVERLFMRALSSGDRPLSELPSIVSRMRLPGVDVEVGVKEYLYPISARFHHDNHDDIRARAGSLFGKSKVTRPLMAALHRALDDGAYANIAAASLHRARFNSDQLIEVLDLEEIAGWVAMAKATRFMKYMSGTRAIRLMQAPWYPLELHDLLVTMARNDIGEVEGLGRRIRRCRTIEEIHDTVVAEALYYGRRQGLDGIYGPVAQELYRGVDGATLDGTTIVTPKRGEDLVRWGNLMRHCIGAYARDAVTGRVQYLAILHEGQMVANIAMSSGDIYQFYGKRNSAVPREVVENTYRMLYRHDMIKPNNFDHYDRWVAKEGRERFRGDPGAMVVRGQRVPVDTYRGGIF